MAVTHDSYVKNTTDFIDKVTGIEIPRDALLFSVDVESLYTNIDNNSGIEAVKLITCNACSVSYVGETGNQLRTRLINHRSDIRHNNDTQVARHFNEAGHSYAESQSWNQGHFLTTPHWKPSTDGTVNPNGLQDLKLGSQEVYILERTLLILYLL